MPNLELKKPGAPGITIEWMRRRGWITFTLTGGNATPLVVKARGVERARRQLGALLDELFLQGYRLTRRGRLVYPTRETRLLAKDGRGAIRLRPSLIATLAEAVSKGAAPSRAAAALESAMPGYCLSPMERQQIIAVASATHRSYLKEGAVNQRWRTTPEIDQGLVQALVNA